MSVDFVGSNTESLDVSAATYGLDTAFTVAMWIKCTVADIPDSTGGLIEKESSELLITLGDGFNSRKLMATFENDSSWGSPSATTISDATWTHIALTYDDVADEFSFFFDGVKDSGSPASVTTVMSEASSSLHIGRRATGAARRYDGLIEDVAIWNRELGDGEIASIAKARLRAGFVQNGLSAWWPLHVAGDGVFNDVTTTDIGCRDHSGNGKHIDGISGTPTWSADTPGLHWPSRPMIVPFASAGEPPAARRISLGAAYVGGGRVVLIG